MLIKVTQHQKKKKKLETHVFQAGLELVWLKMILTTNLPAFNAQVLGLSCLCGAEIKPFAC